MTSGSRRAHMSRPAHRSNIDACTNATAQEHADAATKSGTGDNSPSRYGPDSRRHVPHGIGQALSGRGPGSSRHCRVVASYCLLCLRNKGPRLSACSNLFQHAPKWRVGSETHGSIRIQEGQPNLSFCRCDRAADRNAFRSLPTGQRLSQSGTHLTVLPSAAIVTRFDADHSDLRRRERSRGARLLLLGMKRILDAV